MQSMNMSLNPLPLWDTNLAKDLSTCLSPFLLVKQLQHWSWWEWTLFIKLNISLDKKSCIALLRPWAIQSWGSVQQTRPADNKNSIKMLCLEYNSQIIAFSSNWCRSTGWSWRQKRKDISPPGFSSVGRSLVSAPWSQWKGIQGSWWAQTWLSISKCEKQVKCLLQTQCPCHPTPNIQYSQDRCSLDAPADNLHDIKL